MLLIGEMNKKKSPKALSFDGGECLRPYEGIIFENHKYIITLNKLKFELYDKSQKRFTLYLTATSIKNKVIRVNILESSTYNKIKAHLFYKKILELGYVLWTNEQSFGGRRVWEKLSKIKKVDVHGWLYDRPVNIDLNEDTEIIYIEPSETKGGHHEDIKHLTLIAHIK